MCPSVRLSTQGTGGGELSVCVWGGGEACVCAHVLVPLCVFVQCLCACVCVCARACVCAHFCAQFRYEVQMIG